MSKKPVAIIILDGFGWRNEMMGNAVKLAKRLRTLTVIGTIFRMQRCWLPDWL